eukprot:692387-Ditylum_brightwellii.AAC.1
MVSYQTKKAIIKVNTAAPQETHNLSVLHETIIPPPSTPQSSLHKQKEQPSTIPANTIKIFNTSKHVYQETAHNTRKFVST